MVKSSHTFPVLYFLFPFPYFPQVPSRDEGREELVGGCPYKEKIINKLHYYIGKNSYENI